MSQPNPPPGSDEPTVPLSGQTSPLAPNWQGAPTPPPPGQGRQIPPWNGGPAAAPPATPGRTSPVPTFRGQQPDETAIFIRRQHPLFLVLPLWPALLSALAFAALHLTHSGNTRFNAFVFLASGLLLAIFALFLLKWLVLDLVNWFFNIFVLTDRRVIDARGFFTPNRQEAQLDRIQQVQLEQNNVFEFILDIGDVQVFTAGSQGDLRFARVPHPREMVDQIREAERAYRTSGRAPAPPIEPEHPAVKAALDEMTKPVNVPTPPAADPRTYGGFLQRPARLHMLDDEVIVNYIHRHWFVLVWREVLPALVMAAAIVLGGVLAMALHSSMWLVGIGGLLIGMGYAGLVYLNYIDDIFILTTDRVVDIDRYLFFFFEGRKQADYTKVQDVRVNVNTLLARILNYGDIIVETAGRLPNIEMTSIPNPFAVQDLIFTRMNALKERELARAANRQRLENRRLIAGTMNQLLVAVPDVRRLTLLDAGEALRIVGLKLKVDAERPARGVPPGSVVTQMPGPAATALRDSEVYVVLSGRG
jgi:PH (Pleckstrin Homology) domain-containing protein/PASTA domain-containing protein